MRPLAGSGQWAGYNSNTEKKGEEAGGHRGSGGPPARVRPSAIRAWGPRTSVLTRNCPPITIWTKYARAGAVQG